MRINKAQFRGESKSDWLESRHSFNFNYYYESDRNGFGKLIVLNDDIIAPGKGFEPHPHNNMEIITLVLEGKLEHTDSTGKKAILEAGDVQVMSAGKGIVHAERNASKKEELKLLQIWIRTRSRNAEPRHEDKKISHEINKLNLISSGGESTAPIINQDAWIYTLNLENHEMIYSKHEKSNGIFIFVIEGTAEIKNLQLNERDSAELTDENEVKIKSEKAKLLIIEVPM